MRACNQLRRCHTAPTLSNLGHYAAQRKYLQTVKATGRRDLPADRRGLILRLSVNRGRTVRTFRFRYFRSGPVKYVRLGEYPALTLADAHELHARCVTAVKNDGDPQAVVDAYWVERIPVASDGNAAGPTVRDVVREFLAVAARERKRPEQVHKHNAQSTRLQGRQTRTAPGTSVHR